MNAEKGKRIKEALEGLHQFREPVYKLEGIDGPIVYRQTIEYIEALEGALAQCFEDWVDPDSVLYEDLKKFFEKA
jgi:hypothetical protein